MKILIVDDSSSIRMVVKKFLTHDKIELFEAENGLDALKMIHDIKPDIVILDVMMPKMNGLEVCFEVRSSPEIESTYIILLSSKGEKDDKMLGLGTGADAYLSKPFTEQQLKEKVKFGIKKSNDWNSVLIDPETGLGNGPGFIDALRRVKSDFVDNVDSAHLLFAEIDSFESHTDENKKNTIKFACGLLKSQMIKGDQIFNMGEGLFAFISTTRDLDDMISVIERLQIEIKEKSIEGNALSASMGLAGAETKEECEKILNHANEALEDAKSLGVGHTEIYHSF